MTTVVTRREAIQKIPKRRGKEKAQEKARGKGRGTMKKKSKKRGVTGLRGM